MLFVHGPAFRLPSRAPVVPCATTQTGQNQWPAALPHPAPGPPPCPPHGRPAPVRAPDRAGAAPRPPPNPRGCSARARPPDAHPTDARWTEGTGTEDPTGVASGAMPQRNATASASGAPGSVQGSITTWAPAAMVRPSPAQSTWSATAPGGSVADTPLWVSQTRPWAISSTLRSRGRSDSARPAASCQQPGAVRPTSVGTADCCDSRTLRADMAASLV